MEQVPRKGAKTDKNRESSPKRDSGGLNHRIRKMARWGRVTLAQSCLSPASRLLDFLFKPPSAFLLGTSLGSPLATFWEFSG